MHALPRRVPAWVSRFYLFAAALAAAAQLVLVLAPLAEGRAGVGMGAHVEAHGNASHHVHEDATCVACQARSVHGVARGGPVPPAVERVRSAAPLLREQFVSSADLVANALPRAPPCVI